MSSSRLLTLTVCLLLLPAPGHCASLFSDEERARIAQYWNAPGRYRSTAPPEAAQNGPWVVRLTPEGSKWFLAYQKAIGQARAPPTVVGTPSSPETEAWERWAQAKLDFDRWRAQQAAEAANAAVRAATNQPEGTPLSTTSAAPLSQLTRQRDVPRPLSGA